MKNRIISFLFWFIVFTAILLLFSSIWVKKTFNIVNFDSVIYHLHGDLTGTSKEMIGSYFKDAFLQTIFTFIIFTLIIKHNYMAKPYLTMKFFKYKYDNIDVFKAFKNHRLLFSFTFFIVVVFYIAISFGLISYGYNLLSSSAFIEENYVNPKETNVTFSKKKNLIHIYVESLEQTFLSKEYGGAYDENLLPNLTKYLNKEVSFTNSNNGGFYNSRGTEWTIASMVAQTSGVALIIPIDGNSYGDETPFLPGAYTMGEILEKEGYNQVLLIGSDASFAGRREYFTQHGNYEIKDYLYAIENDLIPKDYYVWWGYEDSKLFEFAKDELKRLSKKNEPFNLTLLTANMHHIGGYLEDSCEVKYDEQLKNVVLCNDKQIYEFVEWVKKQSFYKDTVIVITGDHLSMEPEFFNDLDDYERTSFNLFINANKSSINKTNRIFSTLDMYPTILSSIGANIDGNRLGLGTNLFSHNETLYEKYGKEYVDSEYKKTSVFYNKKILYDEE